jgi:transposase
LKGDPDPLGLQYSAPGLDGRPSLSQQLLVAGLEVGDPRGDQLGTFLGQLAVLLLQALALGLLVGDVLVALLSIRVQKRRLFLLLPEREILRKDKALAEVTALLVLKKKVQEIWGDGDENTPTKSGT